MTKRRNAFRDRFRIVYREIFLLGARMQQPEPDLGAEGERELASLQADFPAYEIWREVTGHGVLYNVRGRTLGLHPHTVVGSDPGSIRAALDGSNGRGD